MAPPHKKGVTDGDKWWRNAYIAMDDVYVDYELTFGKDLIKPGTKIKIKYARGIFKFRCLAHNIKTDTTWFDCVDTESGEWRSFRIEQLKGVVKPKRSRAKKPIT